MNGIKARCGSMGKKFDSSQVKDIQNNVTNQAEILKKFGTAFKHGAENGQTMWTYDFNQWNAVGPAQSKDLVILFDKNNTVKAYRFTATEPE